jgi:hypothetical protein
MGLATLSIMGTTRALFVDNAGPTLPYTQQ